MESSVSSIGIISFASLDIQEIVRLAEAGGATSYRTLAESVGVNESTVRKNFKHRRRISESDALHAAFRRVSSGEVQEDRPESGRSSATEVEDGERQPFADEELEHDYFYSGTHFVFSVEGKTRAVPAPQWERILYDYVEAGKDMTRAEIAREHHLPRKVVEICLRKYGAYKASPPVSRERLSGAVTPEAEESLAEEIAEARQDRFLNRLERKNESKRETRLMELERFHHNVKEGMAALLEEMDGWRSPEADPVVDKTLAGLNPEGAEFAAQAPIADLHAGKLVWGKESFGRDYDTRIAADRLQQHGEWLAATVAARAGRCSTLYLPDAGDLFHTLTGETEHGTILQFDSRPKKVWRETYGAKVAQIEFARRVADKVVVKGASGNHDHLFHYLFFDKLAERYRDAEDVVVDDDVRPTAYYVHGLTAHIFDHGQGIPKNLDSPSAKEKVRNMIQEVMGDDYWRCRYFYVYVGHLHEESVGGVVVAGSAIKIMRLPALCEADEYESSGYYSSPEPVAQLQFLRPDGRPDGESYLYI